ncbi:MAG: hypothetical protein GX895_14060 [Clostridiales bacterium]|uniref:hypothetical protein n=1 Tax=Clostridium sp. N3C TaxID=1776758 RepID=UPI00092E06CE|nr:hypothetical protein [Clostridium sp. N3C]NLZ49877.1 hypothetical protein [Clostridiales bacterium]SCN24149.1 hypothetical protein N3C_1673 [Clostridium sp. N3C]
MAELTISMSEAVSILQSTLSKNSDNIKKVELFDKNKIRLTVSISKLLPDVLVTLSYKTFEKGLMKFDVSSKYPSKMLQPFVNNLDLEDIDDDIFSLSDNELSVNIKDLMKHYAKDFEVNDVKFNNNVFTFVVSFKK